MVQNQLWVLFVRVLIEVVDAAGVEAVARRLMPCTSYPFSKSTQLGAAVLASDASDQSDLGHGGKARSCRLNAQA